MPSHPFVSPPVSDLDARALFAARLARLSAAENPTAKKRGSFLSRRFFGGRDRDGEVAMPAAAPAVSLAEPDGSALPVPALPAETPVIGDAAPEFPPPRISVPPFDPPATHMTSTQSTTHLPEAGRASAQLTLAFEITSLQLTPFFRLGSVQLKALSNVVSLAMVAAQQADRPLAAGISFQIERVELDETGHLKSIGLKPLGESHEVPAPQSNLLVDGVALNGIGEDAPISVTTSGAASTAVQVVATFHIAGMEFSPAFEIDSLRLEPAAGTVLLRVGPSSGDHAQALPSSFDFAEVQLGDGAQIRGARLVPSTVGNA